MSGNTAVVRTALPHFDFAAFTAALDGRRRELGLGWYDLADELWEQSADLNAQRMAHPLCGGAVTRLPAAGPDRRLRWDLPELYVALNRRRQRCGLSWAQLAHEIHCTPGRLTNLRTARLADLDLAMRVTQWLGRRS